MTPEEQIAYLRGEGLGIADELAIDFQHFASASYDGLRTAPEWERVRTHARRLLEEIGDIGTE